MQYYKIIKQELSMKEPINKQQKEKLSERKQEDILHKIAHK